jgi:hypothetical protein
VAFAFQGASPGRVCPVVKLSSGLDQVLGSRPARQDGKTTTVR